MLANILRGAFTGLVTGAFLLGLAGMLFGMYVEMLWGAATFGSPMYDAPTLKWTAGGLGIGAVVGSISGVFLSGMSLVISRSIPVTAIGAITGLFIMGLPGGYLVLSGVVEETFLKSSEVMWLALGGAAIGLVIGAVIGGVMDVTLRLFGFTKA